MVTAEQIFYRRKLTRKATGFKALRINYCEINEITSKCQTDFLDKTCKKCLKQKKRTALLNFTSSFNLNQHF